MSKHVLLVDMQSFYANIEKSMRPELQNLPVVVSGDPKRRSGIILAACPLAKSYGIKNAMTLWEAQSKCQHLIVVPPRMQLYIDFSLQLTNLLEQFSDQVEPYSIDEQFVDITGSQQLYGSPWEIAKQIQASIHQKLNLPARIGIGPNKVLAKMACDLFAKKNKQGIFELPMDQVANHLWPLPVKNMFGVGTRMKKRLQKMGIQTIGDLANFPLPQLKKYFGINGHVLWMTANGHDLSPVTRNTFQTPKGIGHQMTLPYDYQTTTEIQTVLLELCEEVCRRSRQHHLAGKTVHVHCRSSDFTHSTGFNRQITLASASNQTMQIFRAAKTCFFRFWQGDPIRSIGLRLSQLTSNQYVQLNLFEDVEKQRKVDQTMDTIKQQFGATALLRASSLLKAGQAYARAQKIGGHAK